MPPTATQDDPHDAHGHVHDHDHEEAHEMEHIRSHIGFYKNIFWALIVLTLVTVGVSYIPFPHYSLDVTVGLIIAAIKATLVALFFMHLSSEKKLIYRVLVFTVFFAAGLIFLCLLAHWDHTDIGF